MSGRGDDPNAAPSGAPLASPHEAGPQSPCVRVCVIEEQAGLCIGCLRRRAEIAGWPQMSAAERQAVLADLPGRAGLLKQRRGGRAGRLARRQQTGDG